MRQLRRLGYLVSRWLIRSIIRPRLIGEPPDPPRDGRPVYLYSLENRSLSDLIVLDLLNEANHLPAPLAPVTLGSHTEGRRVFFLNRASYGVFQRNVMSTPSKRLIRVLTHAGEATDAVIVPVTVLWGRAPSRQGSFFRSLVAEDWAVTTRLKRMLNLVVSRKEIYVNYGTPISIGELAEDHLDVNRMVRRAARLLRVQFRNQRVAAIGPDFSHQRTLVNQILRSRAVTDAIAAAAPGEKPERMERRARKHAMSIVSNMSYPTIRVLERLLTWFWNRIYDGLELHGLDRVMEIAETHTPIYTPSHRSHVDYLLLSYLLHKNGLMIPHIAAGDNMNLPLVGHLLRRGGAFFMRRSFRDDPVYTAVFSEYLYQVYRRGHCVEFFPEGGRTRTGRLLPARVGLLKMTLEHNRRGVPRPLAIVPVYLGYEKLIEGGSYLDELRGSAKQRESIGDILRSLKLIRQNFGQVNVNFAKPIDLNEWSENNQDLAENEQPVRLGQEILERINESAAINPINLVALVTLATPKLAIDEMLLIDQIGCYLQLLQAEAPQHDYTITDQSPAEVVGYVERLGMLTREEAEFGDILCHDPFSAVLMTWYRNNVTHTLALPSLIACMVINRRRPMGKAALMRMVDTVFPYLAAELHMAGDHAAIDRWLKHLVRAGLLELHPAGGYCAPSVRSQSRYRLHLLSRLIMQTLERLYIVVALIGQPGLTVRTRIDLETQSQQVARKMSRIHGLNAPEFFDSRLFNGFIDQLIANDIVTESADGGLTYRPIITNVIKAAESIIDAEFRYAVLRGA
jgi:glycerol-3-phosphate O-acyltransferase